MGYCPGFILQTQHRVVYTNIVYTVYIQTASDDSYTIYSVLYTNVDAVNLGDIKSV